MKREMRAVVAAMLALSAGLLDAAGAEAARAGTARAAHRGCRDAHLHPSPGNIPRVVAATLCLIERERRAHRVGVLRANGYLQQIAADQASNMVIGDYFGDNSPAGTTPWQRITTSRYAAGGHILLAAQNIGWGTAGLATPEAMVGGWMHSPPHRRIMLTGRYRDIGVGVEPRAPYSLTQGAQGATYTVEFAVRGH